MFKECKKPSSASSFLKACGWFFAFMYFTIILSSASPVFAQAYQAGKSSLQKNNTRLAETQLTAALKKSRSKVELAETYKYLGVAQYSNGKKQAASQSFSTAKSLAPSVKLKADEVLDESVIPLFNSARAGAPKSASTPRAPGGKPAASGGISKQKSKRTILKVISNAPSARVSLDGIAYGQAGQDIEVQPGQVVLELSASGYRTKSIRVKLDPLTTSSITVNLDKIVPKAKPKPMVVATNQGIPLPTNNQKANPSSGKQKGKKSSTDLFGGDEDLNQFPSAQGAPMVSGAMVPTAPQQVVPPPAPAQPVMPQQGYGASPYGLQPSYQQPMYPQAQPYGAYPPAAPYPQYPVYQAPVYGPAPYAQPYMQPLNPYGGYPMTPMAAPPMAAPVMPADPYGGYLGPPPETPSAPAVDPVMTPSAPKSDGGGLPPPPILDPLPRKKSKKTAQKSKCPVFVKLLPFGVGQFCNGSTAKGVLFLGGEAGALYFYKSNSDAAASYQSKLNTILAEREAARADVSQDELEAYDAETASKETQANDAINQANQNAQYSLIGFGALWGLGVIDAFVFDTPSKGKSKKSKRRSPRILQSYDFDRETAPYGTWALALLSPENEEERQTLSLMESTSYHVGYTPTQDPKTKLWTHSMAVGLQIEL